MGSCTVQKVKLSLARKIFSRLVKCGLYLIILHICSIQQNTTFEACLNSPVAGISIAGLQFSHCRILQVNNVVTFASMPNVPATKSWNKRRNKQARKMQRSEDAIIMKSFGESCGAKGDNSVCCILFVCCPFLASFCSLSLLP